MHEIWNQENLVLNPGSSTQAMASDINDISSKGVGVWIKGEISRAAPGQGEQASRGFIPLATLIFKPLFPQV